MARGLERALSGQFDLIVLDVILPGLDGFEVLRQLRRSSLIPVLMLTARGEDIDRIVGLELGADDYLPKPSTRASSSRAFGPSPAARMPDPPAIHGAWKSIG
jgi:DNA-binding response OmpR family regulator